MRKLGTRTAEGPRRAESPQKSPKGQRPLSQASPAWSSQRRWLRGGALLLLLLVGVGLWRFRGRALQQEALSGTPGVAAPVDATEARLRDAVARQPGNPAAHAELGRYFLGQARPASALWELEEARSLGAADRGSLDRDQASALALAGQRDLATARLRARLTADPADTEARTQLGELLLAEGRPAEAVGVLSRHGAGLDADATLLIGRADHALGRLAEGEAAFRRYARIAPPGTARYEPLGRFLLATGRPEEARQALMQDQRVSFQRADFHYLLGLTYQRDRRHPDLRKAIGAFNVALHFDPRHSRSLAALGEIFEQQGEASPTTSLRSGAGGGGPDQAVAAYQAAIDADPRWPEPHTRLASLLMKRGRPELAWEQRGIAAMLEDRKPDAVRAYGRMLAAAPGDLQAAKAMVLACVGRKKIGLAQPVVDALRRRPFDPAEAGLIADLYLMTNARDPCRRLAATWQRQQPDSPACLRLLGRLAVDDLHGEEGIKLYQAAWARDPSDPETALALGHAWARVPTRAHLEQARDWFRRATALAPNTARYHADLGQAYQQLGQADAARDEYLRAMDLDPTLSSAASSLAQLGRTANQPTLAQLFEQIARALDDRTLAVDQAHLRLWEHPTAEAEFSLARLMVEAGSLEMARAHLQQALAQRPTWEPALTLRRTVEALLAWS